MTKTINGHTVAVKFSNAGSQRDDWALTIDGEFVGKFYEQEVAWQRGSAIADGLRRVWSSGLEYVLQSAFEAGVEPSNIKLCLTVSGVNGESQAIRFLADLVKCGAKAARDGDFITVEVGDNHASEILHKERL